MEAFVCVLSADHPVPVYHRIGKAKDAEDTDEGRPMVLTYCGRRSNEWPARLQYRHAIGFAEPCATCYPPRPLPLKKGAVKPRPVAKAKARKAANREAGRQRVPAKLAVAKRAGA